MLMKFEFIQHYNNLITESVNESSNKNIDDFKHIEFLGGSTGADLYESPDGTKYVVKHGANKQQLYNEYLSNKIYSDFGIATPKSFIAKLDGEDVYVTEFLEDSIPLGEFLRNNDKSKLKDLSKGFIIDVLLANWDVVGTTYDLDNIRVKDGKAYRVDLGGTLTSRAQGATKNYGYEPSEHKTLKDFAMNYNTATIFAELEDLDIKQQIDDIIKDYVVDGEINWQELESKYKSIIYDDSVDISDKEKDTLIKTLLERTKKLYQIFN